MKRAIRIILITGAAVFGIAVIAILYLVMREGESKDTIVAKAVSPDGRRRLELHEVVAPVHGGADHFQVTLGDVSSTFGDTVYSEKFECTDFKAFRIWWTDPTHANVQYGTCETGHAEDRIAGSQPASVLWKDVTIALQSSGDKATQ